MNSLIHCISLRHDITCNKRLRKCPRIAVETAENVFNGKSILEISRRAAKNQ